MENSFQNLHQALLGEFESRGDARRQLVEWWRAHEHVQAFFASIEQNPVTASGCSDHLCHSAVAFFPFVTGRYESNSCAHSPSIKQVGPAPKKVVVSTDIVQVVAHLRDFHIGVCQPKVGVK